MAMGWAAPVGAADDTPPAEEISVFADEEYRAPVGPHASPMWKPGYYPSGSQLAFADRERPGRLSDIFTTTKVMSFVAGFSVYAHADRCAQDTMTDYLFDHSSKPVYIIESSPATESFDRHWASTIENEDSSISALSMGDRSRLASRYSTASELPRVGKPTFTRLSRRPRGCRRVKIIGLD